MIIGITGTDGAGKGTAVTYLVTKKGYTHYSSRELLTRVLLDKGLPIDRNQMRLIANELRATYGDDFIVRKALEQMTIDGVKDAVIESIRAMAEADTLKASGGILLAIDASSDVRYARVQERRSETDKVSYEQFLAHEELERNDPDPHGMQKASVMAIADYVIYNNNSIEALEEAVEAFLEEFSL